jgi:hypothetical protein
MSDRLKYTEGMSWPVDDGFTFPEHAIDTYEGKRDFGVCVSGGGTRSASLTAGQLRALQVNGILDRAGNLSCVSGGAWASVPFTYLDSGIPDSTYLGATPSMDALTLDNLEQTEKYSLARAASDAGLFDDFLKNLFAGDERFSQMIGNVFLKPFNIGSESRFFSLDTPTVLKILNENPNMLETDFYTVNRNGYRPFLIAGGTILRPGFKRFHFEMTPLYLGTYSYHKTDGSDSKLPIGGGYVALTFSTQTPLRKKTATASSVFASAARNTCSRYQTSSAQQDRLLRNTWNEWDWKSDFPNSSTGALKTPTAGRLKSTISEMEASSRTSASCRCSVAR